MSFGEVYQNMLDSLMKDLSVKLLPDLNELKDTEDRKARKKWQTVAKETTNIFTRENIATILREKASEILYREGIFFKIPVNSIPENVTLVDIELAVRRVLEQKGYNATTETETDNSFSLSIKRIEK